MGLLDSLRGLFGSGGKAGPKHEVVEYQGFKIQPAPQRQASGWNTAGVITKEYPDGVKEHSFIRVDTHSSQDDAVAFSVIKAQQIIDEQGDRMFR
ncbi:MAG: HlyU family transcriptional regulator [Pseudomonadota bacterium]